MKKWMKGLLGVVCALSFMSVNAQEMSAKEVSLAAEKKAAAEAEPVKENAYAHIGRRLWVKSWSTELYDEYKQMAASTLSDQQQVYLESYILNQGGNSEEHVEMFVDGMQAIKWNPDVRRKVRDAFLKNEKVVTIYECNGGTVTVVVGASYGECTGLELHKNGEAKLGVHRQVGGKAAAGAEAKAYSDIEVRTGASLVTGLSGEFDLSSSMTLFKELGIDWIDLDLGMGGESDAFLDKTSGTGLGFSFGGLMGSLNIPKEDVRLAFQMSDKFMKDLMAY